MKRFFLLLLSGFFISLHGAPGSYPFVSERTFVETCDHGERLNPQHVRNGDIIYVHMLNIGQFFANKHPHIKAKYILVSHGHWRKLPGEYARYLDDHKIIAWFTKNADRVHPKLHPIPIGLVNPSQPQGNITIVKNVIAKAKPLQDRNTDKLIVLNHLPNSNPSHRNNAYNILMKQPFSINLHGKPFALYMDDMSQFRFVASPFGLGPDCHRTWEAMYVGTIPIYPHSPLDSLLADLPVVLINDWKEVTAAFLEEKYLEVKEKLANHAYNLDKLYADYWINKLRTLQRAHR